MPKWNLVRIHAIQRKWPRGRSVCTCGHVGDGPHSQHRDCRSSAGHGACSVRGCSCRKFRWQSNLPEFAAFVEERKRS